MKEEEFKELCGAIKRHVVDVRVPPRRMYVRATTPGEIDEVVALGYVKLPEYQGLVGFDWWGNPIGPFDPTFHSFEFDD